MTAYQERERMYEEMIRRGYRQIMEIAKVSPYPSTGNGKQYFDFIVGQPTDKVTKARVMIDFRGEYFSSFFIGTSLPVSVTSPIRNRISFTAKEAYDYIISKVKELNS